MPVIRDVVIAQEALVQVDVVGATCALSGATSACKPAGESSNLRRLTRGVRKASPRGLAVTSQAVVRLGRDVLSQCRFFYNGPAGKFLLAW